MSWRLRARLPSGGVMQFPVRIGLHGFSGVLVSLDIEGNGADEFTGIPGADD